VVIVTVAVLVGIVWYLAGRTSRSSAGSDPSAAAVTSAVPTMTGVLANSSGPSRSTAASAGASPSPSTGASPSPSTGASPTATASPKASGSAAATGPAESAVTTAPTTEAAPPTPSPTTTAPPPPSYDADGKLLCADASVALAAQAPAEVTSGATVIVGMTIVNAGAEPCRRDVSGTLQVFTVFGPDGTRMWSTADCFPGTGTEVRDLAPGQSLEYTIKWSGTTSTPGCTGDRPPLAPGTYTLIAQLGGLSSPPAAFTVG
jgi:hypothetical protein